MRTAISLICLTLVIAPQLLGGAVGWSVVVITILSIASALSTSFVASGRTAASSVVLIASAAFVLTFLQSIPLPRAVVSFFSASAVTSTDGARAALGLGDASWLPLSYDPGATRMEVLKGVALLCVFITCSSLVRLQHRRTLARAISISALCIAVVTLAHVISGLSAVFGVIEPSFAPILVSPILNSNHLAGFLVMGAIVTLGLALDDREKESRLLWMGAALLIAAVSVSALSRGGIIALVVGVCLFGLLTLLQKRERLSLKTSGPLVMILGFLGLLGYFSLQPIMVAFEDQDLSKIEMAKAGLSLAQGHPFLGVGRGAFSATFASVMGTRARFEYPENIVVQWLVEWGIPFGLAMIAIVSAAVIRATERLGSSVQSAALSSVVALGIHNLVDFSLEMLGIAVVAAATLAVGLPTPRRKRSDSGRRPALVTIARGVSIAGIIVTALYGYSVVRGTVFERRARLAERLAAGDVTENFEEELREGVMLHPAEPAFSVYAASAATQRRDPVALRWASRAMAQAPGWSAPHVNAAHALLLLGRLDQALLEIRQAETREPRIAEELMCRILTQRPEVELALRAAPEDEEASAKFLDRASGCRDLPADLVSALDDHLLSAGANVLGVVIRQGNRLIVARELNEAIALLRPVVADHPESARAAESLARALHASGDSTGALAVLQQASHTVSDRRVLIRLRARIAADADDAETMREAVAELRGLSSGSARGLARSMIYLGQLEAEMGNDGHAFRAFEEAHAFDDSSPALVRVARLAERRGQFRRALNAFTRLCHRDGESSAHCESRERIRARVERSTPLGQPSKARNIDTGLTLPLP